jgi:PucR family transcriptional regulator, purine catabolism regulatory protein
MHFSSADIAAPAYRPTPVAQLRQVHLGMLDAVLSGGGVASVARLAADALDGTVVVTLPALDLTVCSPDGDDRRVTAVRRHVEDRSAPIPLELAAEAPVLRGDEPLGVVVLLGGRRRATEDAEQVLRLAALAVLTAVTLEDGTGGGPAAGTGALFEELNAESPPSGERIVARARQLGRDLRYGGVALCATPETGTAQRALAAIVQDAPRALVHAGDGVVEALLPAGEPSATGPDATELAQRAARRLRQHGTVGLSAPECAPAELPRALREARVVLELGARGEAELDALQTGAWRLLTRLAVMAPAEVERLLASTLGPLLDAGTRSGGALLDTLVTYLGTGASMRATAAAGFAHRHTVAYRLERICELTGHDPRRAEGLEQLNLGLKARAVRDALAAATPRRTADSRRS